MFDSKENAKINDYKEWVFKNPDGECENNLHVMFSAVDRYHPNDAVPLKPRIAFDVSLIGTEKVFHGCIQWDDLDVELGYFWFGFDADFTFYGSTAKQVVDLLAAIRELAALSFNDVKTKVGL